MKRTNKIKQRILLNYLGAIMEDVATSLSRNSGCIYCMGGLIMILFSAFIGWVLIMLIEVIWLMNDISGGARNIEVIYVIIVISLVVGATGLNLYSKHISK
jgi:hypothetical protein